MRKIKHLDTYPSTKSYLYSARSKFTRRQNLKVLYVSPEQIKAWHDSGKHISEFFPKLSREDRDFLLYGTIPEEQFC